MSGSERATVQAGLDAAFAQGLAGLRAYLAEAPRDFDQCCGYYEPGGRCLFAAYLHDRGVLGDPRDFCGTATITYRAYALFGGLQCYTYAPPAWFEALQEAVVKQIGYRADSAQILGRWDALIAQSTTLVGELLAARDRQIPDRAAP